MDPLSALSVAAAVVDLADYGIRLLSNTVENYRPSSATSRENHDLEAIARDLVAMNEQVQFKSQVAANSSEDVFIRLCADCAVIGKELQECVAAVRGRTKTSRLVG